LKNWLVGLLLLFLWLFSQLSLADPEKEEVTIVDDGWVEVPLDFTFPFYSNSYVTSFMFSNGVIGFMNPNTIPGSGIVYDGLCCNSFDFTASNNNYGNHGGVRFDYVIMPWHTDLIDIGTGKFYIQGDDTFQSYFWENISEYYDNTDLNTFDTTIYPTGNIRFAYQALDIQSHSVTVAIVGDLSAGEYTQWFYNNPSTDGGVYWTSGDTAPVEISGGQSICDVDSTASYVCTYYAVGYAEEIYNNACAASALYDSGCPGWAAAYLSQQCGISSLYSPSCSGYEQAYIDNQCTLDPLYSVSCAGYSLAVAEEEAEEESSQNEEYEDEWEEYVIFEPETSFDDYNDFEIFDFSDFSMPTDTNDQGFEPQFEDFDTSFEDVFAELEMEMMQEFEDFSMDIFEETFEEIGFDMPEMDSIDFELPELENLTEEVMEEMPEIELETDSAPEEVLTEETLEEPEMEEPEMEPELEPEPEEVLDEPSNEEETETEPESEEEGEVLEDEQDEQQEEEAEEEDEGSTDEESDEEVEEESEEETESEEEESEETMMADSEEEDEPEEELIAEAEIDEPTPEQKKKSKEKKMREIITAKLNNLAKEMGEAASLEAQKEIQSYILALLNFNLGFNSYNSSMVDGLFYTDRDIYLNKKVPENQRGLRNGLANEILHNKLVDIQYREDYGRSRVQGD